MIEGTVNENYEAAIRLTLRGVAGEEHAIEAIIDTGFILPRKGENHG